MRPIIVFLLGLCAYAQTIPSPGPGMYPSVVSCTSGACSDSFTGTANTLLATHDSHWAGNSAGNCKLSGSSTVWTSTSYLTCGASYTASTSDTSQVVVSGFTGGTSPTSKGVTLRVDPAFTVSYWLYLGTPSGGNWTRCAIFKTGVSKVTTTVSFSQSVDHTIKAVASGTNPVVLTLYVDGSSACTYTDSSSPLSAGYPGIVVAGNGTNANNTLSAWQDH